MRYNFTIIALLFSICSNIALAAAPTITSPANGTYVSNSSPFDLYYTTTSNAAVTITRTNYSGVSTSISTVDMPQVGLNYYNVPSASGLSPGQYSYALLQSGLSSDPVIVNVITFSVQSPLMNGFYKLNTDLLVKFTTSVVVSFTATLSGSNFDTVFTSPTITPTGPPGSYVGSFVIPGTTFSVADNYYLNWEIAGSPSSIPTSQFNTGTTGSNPPFPISYVAQSYIPIGRAFDITYKCLTANVVTSNVTTTAGTVNTSYSTPVAASDGAYYGTLSITAAEIGQAGTLSFQFTQAIPNIDGPVDKSSIVYTYTVQSFPSIVGYNSAMSVYSVDNLPSISATTPDATNYFAAEVTNTDTGASYTQYYATTLDAGVYSSDAFSLSTSPTNLPPTAGNYMLVVSANGLGAAPITYAVIASAPNFLSPLNNSLVSATSPVLVKYIAYAGSAVNFDTVGASTFTNTSYPEPTSDGRLVGSIAIYPLYGTYTITMTQDGISSLPLVITVAAAPTLTAPLANSYNPLSTDLVISFTAGSTALVTVNTTYNGQTVSQTTTPDGSGVAIPGSVTVPAGRLTVPGKLSIVASQNSFSIIPIVVNIGSQPAAPVITSLVNNSYVLAHSDLSFTYTATNLTAVSLTATPYSGGSPLTPFITSKTPTLSESIISGTFTVPAATVQSTLQLVLSQDGLTSEPLTVLAITAPAISSPPDNGKIGLSRALPVSFTSDSTLTGDVSVTLTRPDTSTTVQTKAPVAGTGSVEFAASDIAQSGVYTLSIAQVLPDGTNLVGSAIIHVETGVVPVIDGLVSSTNYTQNSVIAPVVQVPTIADITTVAVTVVFNGFTQSQNYPLTDLGDGNSQSYPIQLNHPYNFLGNEREFAPLGKYTLTVTYNGVASDPVSYMLISADPPVISYPTTTEDPVAVSASNPLTVVYDSPADYNFDLTFTLTKEETTGRLRRADPLSATSTPNPNGGGSAVFEGTNAPTTSGTYTLSVSQLAPDGSSIEGGTVTFPIVVNAASGAAGRARKVRRLIRRSRCNKPETECPTASGSFECIDLTTELTSCGGCNPDIKEGSPFDCTLIPRARGVGCANGQCIVFSCDGFAYIPTDSQTACVRRH